MKMTSKYHPMDIWCMVSQYNSLHNTNYWDFEELTKDTGLTMDEFLWEME